MSRFIDFITKINQVLLFFALLGALGLICVGVYSSMSRSFEPPQVKVAASGAATAATEIRDIRFLGLHEGNYIFGLMKTTIASGDAVEFQRASTLKLYSSASGDRNPGQIVNVIYSRDGKVVKTLLPHDGLVLRESFPEEYENRKALRAHLFTCITEDTNNDHVLNEKDRQDLIIVDPSLKLPDTTIHDASDWDILSSTEVLVKVRTADALRFVKVDTTTGAQTEITWK